MSRSALATVVVDFGTAKSGERKEKISKITIHHMACNMAADDCARMHKTSKVQASANYYIGSDGTICSGVDEDRRAWTSSSSWNDSQAITIEVANNTGEPTWTISDAAYNALINLCADICKRYNIDPKFDGSKQATLTAHYFYSATACPGPYVKKLLKDGQIEKDIKAKLKAKPAKPDTNTTLYRVQTGAFRIRSNADKYNTKIRTAGFNTYIVQSGGLYKIQVGAFRDKANAENMLKSLIKKGFDGFITTESGTAVADRPALRDSTEVAKEIIAGKGNWGTGATRKKRLTAAGYNYNEIQHIINKLMS